MGTIENFGILASLSWNRNRWAGDPSTFDIKKSNYKFVKKHHSLFESITFGHLSLKCEDDNYFIGYTPTFQDRMPQNKNSENLSVVFFRSLNPSRNKMFIVGCYAFPEIGIFYRKAKEEIYTYYNWGNIKADVENIVLFDEPIHIDKFLIFNRNFIASDKEMSRRGFNYLSSAHSIHILNEAVIFNPKHTKIREIKLKLRYGTKTTFTEFSWNK